MPSSNQQLVLIGALIVVSACAALLHRVALRRRRADDVPGWGGALFIVLCWIAALALIVYRTAH